MAHFEWNSRIELGHPLLDEHHKRLFSLSEAVAQTLADSRERRLVSDAIQELIDFAREHFASEERLMRESNYPNTEAHSVVHTLLLVELNEYWFKAQETGSTNLTVTRLVAFLWHWLMSHIDSSDRELVGWLRSR